MVKECRFFRNSISPENGVGLRLYNVYMVSKNGCDWFHQVLTCFALKKGFSWKVIKRDELCDSHELVVFSRWNVIVYSTALICSLEVYLLEALDLVYLVLVQ
jgi:hypothetical protein